MLGVTAFVIPTRVEESLVRCTVADSTDTRWHRTRDPSTVLGVTAIVIPTRVEESLVRCTVADSTDTRWHPTRDPSTALGVTKRRKAIGPHPAPPDRGREFPVPCRKSISYFLFPISYFLLPIAQCPLSLPQNLLRLDRLPQHKNAVSRQRRGCGPDDGEHTIERGGEDSR